MRLIGLVLLIFMLSFAASAQEGEGVDVTLTVDGIEREYYLYIPPGYDESEPAPLVVALHGAGGTALEMVLFSGFNILGDESGYIVAFPNAVEQAWNYLDPTEEQLVAGGVPNDVNFLTALIDDVSEDYAVDESRIYAAGYSNGALMAMRLRCELADRLAGVASVGAAMTFSLSQECLEAEPVSHLLVIGTVDSLFPWQGYAQVQEGRLSSAFSVSQTMSFMGSLNGCTESPEFVQVAAPTSEVNVLQQTLGGCDDDNEVALYALVEFGHNWPNSARLMLEEGETITMSQAIFQFFDRNARDS